MTVGDYGDSALIRGLRLGDRITDYGGLRWWITVTVTEIDYDYGDGDQGLRLVRSEPISVTVTVIGN